jgi:two-component system, LytTR family, sensor kinase
MLRPLLFPGYDPLVNSILFFVQFAFLTASWELFRLLNKLLNIHYPFERSMTWRIIIQLMIGSIIMIMLRALLQIVVEPQLPLHIDSLFRFSTYALFVFVSVVINLGYIADYFIERWKESINKAARLEQEKLQIQLNNLKNQFNPHFLFNALTSLNSLIFEDQKLASEFLHQLSRVYHYILQHKDKNFVALSTELEFIDHYIGLLKTRFGNAINIQVNISKEAKDRAIVPATLQGLLENAIKHNMLSEDKVLRIQILSIGNYLVVSNNLQKKKRVENSNGEGLENLKKLYSLITDKAVIVQSDDDSFEVKLPLI